MLKNFFKFLFHKGNAPKEKSGGLETKVLGDEDHPLEMQAQKPKGQVRFGVQPRNGIVVKVYDGRVWPVVLFGDVYITTEFTTQLVIHHLLSSALPKKQLTKYTLALGSSHGKIHRFLSDVEQPVRVLQDPRAQAGGDLCFLIVKKPKAAKKHMFRSLSWASISKLGQGQPMSHPDGVFQNDGKKQKKYRLKKKKDGRGVSTESLATSDSTSSEEHIHLGENLTSTPIKRNNSSYANGHRKVNGHSKENGHPVLIASASDGPLRSKTFSLSGMPQNSSLTLFYSCDNVSVAPPPNNINTDSESELSSTEVVDDKMQRQPPKYSEHTGSSRLQEQREAEDTLSDLQVVLRTRSLGDLTANQTMSLAPEHSGLRESWHESSDRPRYIHSAGSTRTVTVNPPAAKRDVPRQRPTRQNRRSCVARIEDKENRDYLEDYCGRTLQKTPRQRRSLPQIPNNEIDDKKRHLAELMMRRLTVCNGEIATYLQDGRLTGSLNEIRDGRYISSAHIHLTPSDSLISQLDESPPSDRDFDSGNGYRESPVQIISSPRSPHSVISQNYGQHNVRRRTPDPFTASPKMQRMPQIQERDTAHTPLTRIAKSDSHLLQYQVPRSRAALIEAERDAHYNNDVPPSYQSSVGAPRYQGNAPSYFRTSPPGGAPRNRPVFRTNGYQGSGVLNYPSSVSTHYGTLPRGPQTNYVPCSLGEVSSYSTLPRPDKSGSDQRNSQRIPNVSPSKTHSENSNDSGSLNVASRGSMVDSGYGTNGESDYGGVPGRPLQPQKIYPAERQGILKQRSDEFKIANGSFERIPLQSSPDPVTSNPAPSLHQLLSVCSIHASKLSIPNNKLAANLIQIHEDSINLPRQKDHSSGNSPKGKCPLSLGGPGSAFRRVKNNSRDLKCYNLVSVEKLEKVCQPKQPDGVVEKGDFLIEINGHSTLGLDFSSVLSVLEAHQGGQLEVVVARKKPVERVQETLTTEISKLRQQCAYLITEVKSKERIITDLSSVGSGEITPPPVQNLTLDSPMPRQDTYYTCELSEDEFIV